MANSSHDSGRRPQRAKSPTTASSTLVNKLPRSKLPVEATADMAAELITANTVLVLDWPRALYGEIDVTSLQKAVVKAGDSVNRGDLNGAEAILIAQTLSLNTIFASLARRALTDQSIEQFQMNLRLALKTQGQCRATVETLGLMKNPPVVARRRISQTGHSR